MTAEIAIINQRGIALAADSAITVSTGGGQKIFQSANKLFALSKYRPVAAMIYNNANFMDVPWEIIIKLYRERLGQRGFPQLSEYAQDFLTFLEENRSLFPNGQQHVYVRHRVEDLYVEIRSKISSNIFQKLRELSDRDPETKDAESTIEEVVDKIVDSNYRVVREAKPFKRISGQSITDELSTQIIEEFSRDIKEIKDNVFSELPISASNSRKLRIIAENVLTTELDTNRFTGVVIAGYGHDEFFPRIVSYHLEGVIRDTLKSTKIQDYAITFQDRAAIFPFAQSEVVLNFLRGVDPLYDSLTRSEMDRRLRTFSEAIVKKYFAGEANKNAARTIRSLSKDLSEEFDKKLRAVQRDRYVDPILDIVVSLPKPELASMAESLVNLTSLRRRISTDSETVGGPIDVALITKGDGLVWIKRKHYFDPQSNYHFFQNYFREFEDEDQRVEDK